MVLKKGMRVHEMASVREGAHNLKLFKGLQRKKRYKYISAAQLSSAALRFLKLRILLKQNTVCVSQA